MAKKKEVKTDNHKNNPNVVGLHAEVQEQIITETLRENYMPYAMSVIVSRAIPEIDGFKPSHRKLLYTMYQMHLLNGNRTKSANVVGQTMRLNPHGDSAIYETMVRLSRGYGALLHPLVDSKGNFGKVYSRDMAYAASRYTEVRLDPICSQLFADIDKNTVDFVDNYDSTMKEPTLLPTAFPNVLVSANQGIAVGMASNLCGFNLAEVCDATIERMKHPNCDMLDVLPAPDFPTGGELLYNRKEMEQVYKTGRGTFKVRAKWKYIKQGNLIEVYEIPYSTTVEAIMDKVAELIKVGKLKEIADMRDETDLSGLKLAIDLKRGTDPDKLMAKLNRLTPLTDSYPCNFNILVNGLPKVLGVGEILDEWIKWRIECVKRRTIYDIQQKEDRLHLLYGLQKILLDIDKAIKIIRETEADNEVVPNLMLGFGIDQIQAEYVAEIKLRNINKEYITKRISDVASLEEEIAGLKAIAGDEKKIKKVITSELQAIKKKYNTPRHTDILYDVEEEVGEKEDDIPDYPVTLFLSKEGYFKKITAQSLRMSGEQKYKENDEAFMQWEASNKSTLLVFTDQHQCYKAYCYDFADSKASVLGDYLPSALGMDKNEKIVWACLEGEENESIIFFFTNGKAARVSMSAYQTKTKRKKLTNAYSDKDTLVQAYHIKEEKELVITSTDSRTVIFNTALLAPKSSKTSQGVAVISLKKKKEVESVREVDDTQIVNTARYRAKAIPSPGKLLAEEDNGVVQLTLGLEDGQSAE